MWSSKPWLVALAIAAPLLLAGCSGLRPVYGTGGVGDRLELSYAEPETRLEQIIIQDLALRLGDSQRSDVPQVDITATTKTRELTRTSVVKPVTQHEVTITATYTVTSVDGEVMLTGTRRAAADYSATTQVLADEAAAKDAAERAARAVADTIRLSILGQLAAPVREAALDQ